MFANHENHPIARAFERYRVRLTWADLRTLEAQCAAAPTLMRNAYGEVRVVRHGEVVMLAVWLDGIIATFLERDCYGGALLPRPTLADVWPKQQAAE